MLSSYNIAIKLKGIWVILSQKLLTEKKNASQDLKFIQCMYVLKYYIVSPDNEYFFIN